MLQELGKETKQMVQFHCFCFEKWTKNQRFPEVVSNQRIKKQLALGSLVRISEPKQLFLDSLVRNKFSKSLILVHFSKQKQWNWTICFEPIDSLPSSWSMCFYPYVSGNLRADVKKLNVEETNLEREYATLKGL